MFQSLMILQLLRLQDFFLFEPTFLFIPIHSHGYGKRKAGLVSPGNFCRNHLEGPGRAGPHRSSRSAAPMASKMRGIT